MLERVFVAGALAAALSYALGARLSALPGPEGKRLLGAALLGGLLNAASCARPDSALCVALALLALPAGAALCFGRYGAQAVARATVMSGVGSLLLGGLGEALYRACPGAAPWLALALLAPLPALLRLAPSARCEVTQIELRVGASRALLPAMLDSGNLLVDALTGLPVIVLGRRAAEAFFAPEALRRLELLHDLPPGMRLLRARTAAGEALLPIFRPDALALYRDGRPAPARAMIALAPSGYDGVQALVPLAALAACRPDATARAPVPIPAEQNPRSAP